MDNRQMNRGRKLQVWLWLMALTAMLAASMLVTSSHAQSSSAPAKHDAKAAAVRIDNFVFSPATITIAAGSAVTWSNQDDIPHTVVAKDKGFRSAALDTGDEFTHTFAKAGTYAYFCSLHPMMTGKIVVE